MRKKYLSALLFGALLVTSAGTFTSCKDYDDDIKNLQEQIDVIKTDLASLTETVNNLDGVKDMSFADGKLVIETGKGKKVEVDIPSASGITKVELKDNVLYVNDEPQGEVVIPEDELVKVEVKEDGKLYINDEVQDLEIGSKIVMVDNGDYYTMTIDGKESYNLPKYNAAVEISYIKVCTEEDENPDFGYALNKYTVAVFDKETELTSIKWGVSGAKDWKGPKGKVVANQLLIGGISPLMGIIEVAPSTVDLSSQKLELVDSKGNVAPVTVNAVANSEDDILVAPAGRAASTNGKWNLVLTINNTVNKDNITSSFDTNDGSKLYALAVNGIVMTGYDFVVDVDSDITESVRYGKVNTNTYSRIAYYNESKNYTEVPFYYTGDDDKEFQAVILNNLKVGSTTLSVSGTSADKIYDAYIELADEDKAKNYGVTVDGMTITASEKAAKTSDLPINIHILDVTGYEVVFKATLAFGTVKVDSSELEAQSYEVTPSTKYFIVDLGETFTSLTDAEADKVNEHISWVVEEGSKTLNDTEIGDQVTYYASEADAKDGGTNKQIDMEDGKTIKTAKYARINLLKSETEINDAVLTAATAEEGLNKVTITLKDATDDANEIKKVTAELTFTLPEFDELFTKSAAWTANDAVTLRLDGSGTADMLTAYTKEFTMNGGDITPALTLSFDNINNAAVVSGSLATITDANKTFTILDPAIDNTNHVLKSVKAESSYKILGVNGFEVKSGKYTINFISPLDGAKIVYYVDGKEAPLTVLGPSKTFEAFDAGDKDTPKHGIALVINGKDYKLSTATVNGLTLAGDKWESEFSTNAGSAKISVERGALTVSNLAANEYEADMKLIYTESVKTTGSNTVYNSFDLKLSVSNK